MRTIFFHAFMLFIFITQGSLAIGKDNKLEVMSYNIRMDNIQDGLNKWDNRKDYAASVVKFYGVDIVGAQEVLHHQLEDLLERLPEYDYVGVGREDGATKGEYCAIFYKRERFKVLESGTFWLAEDCTKVGVKGWDAVCERVATWAIFKDKESGKSFFMLNTHLDHLGKEARKNGAKLIVEQIKLLAEELPVIVTGDFNAAPETEPIQILVDKTSGLIDSRSVAKCIYGPEWTFHYYGKKPLESRFCIDYIFIKGGIEVLRHGVLTESKGDLYPSDHCPVIATVKF